MATGWALAAQQRTAFADHVDSLSNDQLDSPSFCGGWTVRHVTGHLSVFVLLPFPKFMFNIARSFSYDKAADRMARKMAERPISELTAAIRDNAAKESTLKSFPAEMTTADVTIHLQDVRRPTVGAPGVDPTAVQTALDFVTAHKMGKAICDPKKLAGLRFVADDLDWSSGDGDEIRGTGEALLMSMAGRDAHGELSGPGAATFAGRF